MDWDHGPFGGSTYVLGGLVRLAVAARAKKAVMVNGRRYQRYDSRALEAPDNVDWKATVEGIGREQHIGTYDERDAAVAACEVAWLRLLTEAYLGLAKESPPRLVIE